MLPAALLKDRFDHPVKAFMESEPLHMNMATEVRKDEFLHRQADGVF
jgi:hypothetical protein